MTRTLSFIPSPADVWLEIGEVPRASPLVLTGPAPANHEAYMAQLWRHPTSVHAGGAPLATAYGSASDGVASVAFSAAQLSLTLTADSAYYDDIWMVVSAVQQADTRPAALRWGWMRLVEAGFDPLGEILAATMTFTVTDDICYITYNSQTYTLPVVFVGPATTVAGTITAADDILYFSYGGSRYSSAATRVSPPPPGATDGQGVVIDDVLYVTLAGVCYSAPVVIGEAPPEVPGPTEPPVSVLVTGSDGAQYEKTTYPDGTIRYKPVYETLP